MTSRFFAFGCSYTAFAWPSWSDFVGLRFPDNYYNYGRSGAANNFIFHHLIEMHERHEFTKDDLIIIQWTEMMRESRYLNGWWHTNGSIANSYPKEYIKQYVDPRGFLIRDLTMIAAVTHILDSIGCEYHYLTLNDFAFSEDISGLYAPYLNLMKPSYQQVIGELKSRTLCNQVLVKDPHPTPGEHYKFLSQVLPQWAPEDDTVATAWDQQLADCWHTHAEGRNETWPGIDRGFLKTHIGL